jgi:hypothetical protein
MCLRVDPGQRPFERLPHADLVDAAHVVHLDAGLPQENFLGFVDAANTHQPDVGALDGGRDTVQTRQLLGPISAQARDRHAV